MICYAMAITGALQRPLFRSRTTWQCWHPNTLDYTDQQQTSINKLLYHISPWFHVINTIIRSSPQ